MREKNSSNQNCTESHLSAAESPAETPIRTIDGSNTIFSNRYGETYHSKFGAVTESRHIFLEASGVVNRLTSRQKTRVLEVGFGLGLNFFLTADCALSSSASLEYHAFEHDLPSVDTLQSVGYASLLQHPQCIAQLLEQLASGVGKHQKLQLSDRVTLHLHHYDVCLATLPAEYFHAIYLDPFSPDTNPECWSEVFIKTLALALHQEGGLATYSAKGMVRRAMMAAGLQVQKLPGPPGKREFLLASHAKSLIL
jgi:tRNA U34 5-methylaminomethyl-2-thiouridine-forming methyltransferase MnmC